MWTNPMRFSKKDNGWGGGGTQRIPHLTTTKQMLFVIISEGQEILLINIIHTQSLFSFRLIFA